MLMLFGDLKNDKSVSVTLSGSSIPLHPTRRRANGIGLKFWGKNIIESLFYITYKDRNAINAFCSLKRKV
jgi:hypothetical protein